MTIIDGKQSAEALRGEIAAEVAEMVASGHRAPHLVAVLVGDDGASKTYVANKERMCGLCGFRSTVLRLPAETTEQQLLEQVARLNDDGSVDGFIVQLPLPAHISEQRVVEAIAPEKDVDGFTTLNVGAMVQGLPSFVPATPAGILELLRRYGVQTVGKRCVIIGRSNIVGRPLSVLLSQKGWDATVTVCHSRSENLKQICAEADILVAALGKPGFVTADMVKPGATVIDVGITRVAADNARGWRVVGDVDYAAVAPKCSFITPVPGGVGPMTIISLMKNTLLAARRFGK